METEVRDAAESPAKHRTVPPKKGLSGPTAIIIIMAVGAAGSYYSTLDYLSAGN